ncbi:hypothetical protein KDA82_00635 [Streptomyces daliensis]|uniref:Regulatory protein n=1 Tax=Streptomyces daliensis TaxID=299421 RepID=A0A8T4II00_9ACTN|nr:hypothetical protein [Streptomyces daliensis]
MFGIVRPCRHRLSARMRTEWMAHLCGLCLALRADHGQFSRVATNYDGLIISVLVEAQSRRPQDADHADRTDRWRRTAGPCPLRGMRTASVARGEGARLAAAVSLVLASAKVRDHVADGDGVLARRPVAAAARRVAAGWDRAGARTGAELGFDTSVLVEAVDRQQEIETALTRRHAFAGDVADAGSSGSAVGGGGSGASLLLVTEPTETATAAAFAHTAVLAGSAGNQEPLAEAGRLFGRLAHLLDAVEDLTADEEAGAWNPVAVTGADLADVRRLCDDAVHGVRLALRDVDFVDGKLAHILLGHELKRSVDRVFGTTCAHGHGHAHGSGAGPGQHPNQSPWITRDPTGPPPPPRPPSRRRGLVAGCALWSGLCCTGQVCCKNPYEDPWSGEPREGWCHKCADCCDCCNCDCCNCCGGGEGGEGGGDGGCCDGCDCGCDCGC